MYFPPNLFMRKLGRILLITDTLYILAGGFLGPIYALYVEKIGGDLLDASLTFALFMGTSGIVVFLFSLWEDKNKHQEKFVILGYLFGVIGYLMYLFVNSPVHLFAVQIVLGLSASLKDPSYDALFSEYGRKHLALAWGEWEAMDYFSLAASALVGGYIVVLFGFQTLFYIMIICSLISFLISLLLLRHKKSHAKKE